MDRNPSEPGRDAPSGRISTPPPDAALPAVLLADDDPDVLLLMCRLLGRAGYQVVTAENGEAALRVVASGRPLAAIVTDYAMPGMNGVTMLEKAAQLRPGLPALVITGYADSAGMELLRPGVGVLRKPFMRAELLAKMHQLVASGQPPSASAGAPAAAP